jgi:hypothetical protein
MGLFDPFHRRNHTVLPGIGTIHTQGVANAFVGSLSHSFLAEGADKSVAGSVVLGVRIADDGSTHWVVETIDGPDARKRHYDAKPTENDQADFPAEAVAEMRRLSETLEERDPTGWFFDVLQRAERELELVDRARKDLVRTIEHMDELLGDPSQPRQHYVSKAESGLGKGFHRDATDAERAERRAWWERQREKARTGLAAHDRDIGPRTEMLKVVRSSLRSWSGDKGPTRRRPPSQVMAEALDAHFGRMAA